MNETIGGILPPVHDALLFSISGTGLREIIAIVIPLKATFPFRNERYYIEIFADLKFLGECRLHLVIGTLLLSLRDNSSYFLFLTYMSSAPH